ncbi:MAG: hypothetical protein PHP74_01825 [Candidatus Gracilibacteria bacterium]|nr:hypothetical protein [Candidatus Gracilibacteria bacterium]
MKNSSPKSCFLNSAIFPLIFSAILGITYTISYIILKDGILAEASSITSPVISESFQKLAIYGGIIPLLDAMIFMYILYGLKILFRLKKFHILNPIIVMIVAGAWSAFGYHLAYREPQFTNIAKAIIIFTSKPILISSATIFGLGLIWLIIHIIYSFKKHA